MDERCWDRYQLVAAYGRALQDFLAFNARGEVETTTGTRAHIVAHLH